MNKDLDKKLKFYVIKLMMSASPYGPEWSSSAKDLQDVLKKRGINIKLYYEYKMPGRVSQRDFMNKLYMLNFCEYLNVEYKGYSYANEVRNDKDLTESDKKKIFEWVETYKENIKKYEAEIRQLNPELANIKVETPCSLIAGATFGFAPDEIAYFSDFKNRNQEKEWEISDTLNKIYGIKCGYILAPKTAQHILAELKLREQNIEKEK